MKETTPEVFAAICTSDKGNTVAFHSHETEEEWIESDMTIALEDAR